MNIDGKIEGIQNKTHRQTGDPYRRVVMKGRVFLAFDEGVIESVDALEVDEFVRIEYGFGKSEWGPNVWKLIGITRI